MRLTVVTPLAVIVDAADVAHLRAEDASGAFGVLPGHADFLTALSIAVLSWRETGGAERHVAVRRGMLEVRDGRQIRVATLEAVAGDDLHRLEHEVLTAFRRRLVEERAARGDAQRLYLAAIRQICRYLRPEKTAAMPGGHADPLVEEFEQ